MGIIQDAFDAYMERKSEVDAIQNEIDNLEEQKIVTLDPNNTTGDAEHNLEIESQINERRSVKRTAETNANNARQKLGNAVVTGAPNGQIVNGTYNGEQYNISCTKNLYNELDLSIEKQ